MASHGPLNSRVWTNTESARPDSAAPARSGRIRSVRSASRSGGADERDKPGYARVHGMLAPQHQIQKQVIRVSQQALERIATLLVEFVISMFEKTTEQQIVFQHPAPAAPARPRIGQGHRVLPKGRPALHTERLIMVLRMSPIAFEGFRPFGHTWVQFMMPWQRYRL